MNDLKIQLPLLIAALLVILRGVIIYLIPMPEKIKCFISGAVTSLCLVFMLFNLIGNDGVEKLRFFKESLIFKLK